MTVDYDVIERAFGNLDVEITAKPGKGWFGGKYLEVSAKINAPKAVTEQPDKGGGYDRLVQNSVKLGITDEGYDTVENTEKLRKLVLKTASEAYMTRFLEMPIPDDAISDDYNGKRTEKLDDSDQFELRTHIENSLKNFADTLAEKLAETTYITGIKRFSGMATWFPDPEGDYVNRDKALVYIAAEHVLNKKIGERREKNFLKEKSTTYRHEPQDLAR